MNFSAPQLYLPSRISSGAAANPLTAMARSLATSPDANWHIAIPGFYDDVLPLEDWEREMWCKITVNIDEEILKETGVPELFGEKGFSTMERIWARPTAEINGFGGGYQGQGTKTVIGREAMAKLTFRLVPNQDGDKIIALVQEHMQKNCPPGVKLDMAAGHAGPWYLTDPHSK